jgi:hypothetical protein
MCTWLANRNERQTDIARRSPHVHIFKVGKYANNTQTFAHFAKRVNCLRLNDATRSIAGEDTEKLNLSEVKVTNERLKERHVSGGESQAFHRRGQSMWELWQTKWQRTSCFFCVYFGFPLSGSFFKCYKHKLNSFTTDAIHF